MNCSETEQDLKLTCLDHLMVMLTHASLGRLEVLDSLLPLTDTNEFLSNDNYNTTQEGSVSYNSLKIKPDFTGKKNRGTKPEAAGNITRCCTAGNAGERFVLNYSFSSTYT